MENLSKHLDEPIISKETLLLRYAHKLTTKKRLPMHKNT